MTGEHLSINRFFNELMRHLHELNQNDWNDYVVTSIDSGRDADDNWYWIFWLRNKNTREEKIIQIPCYED